VGDDDIELAVVVEVDGDDCRRVETGRIGEVHRCLEGAVAVAGQQRKADVRIVDGDDQIKSSVAVEVSCREVLRPICHRIFDSRAERPGPIGQEDRR